MSAALMLIFVVATVAAAILTGVARRYALSRAMLDRPNDRSSHTRATPRGGGIAIVVTVILGAIALWFGRTIDLRFTLALVLGGGLVAVVGWLDDRRSLNVALRMVAYIAAATIAVVLLNDVVPSAVVSHPILFLHQLPNSLSILIQLVGVVWFINLFNFLDGIDGYAGAQSLLASLAAAALMAHAGDAGVARFAVVVAGASAGFLIWNWQPARIFMGDVGSCFLGFLFALLAIYGDASGVAPAAIWTVVSGAFFWDATLTLLRRVLIGERWYSAHRSHAYQRLHQLGWSHAQVTLGMIAVTVMLLWPMVWVAVIWDNLAPAAVVASALVVGGLWWWINHRFKGSNNT